MVTVKLSPKESPPPVKSILGREKDCEIVMVLSCTAFCGLHVFSSCRKITSALIHI